MNVVLSRDLGLRIPLGSNTGVVAVTQAANGGVKCGTTAKGGAVKPCSSDAVSVGDGFPVGVLGWERGISNRKYARADARLMAAIFENSDDGILLLSRDGTILRCNRGAERLYGYSQEELRQMSVMALVAPCFGTPIEAMLRELRAGASVIARDGIHRRKDGSSVHVSLSAWPIHGSMGGRSDAVITVRDCTERNRLEREVADGCMLERKRIAHELHDGLAPYLSALAYRAAMLQRSLEDAGLPVAREAWELSSLLRGAVRGTRLLAQGQDCDEIVRTGFSKAMRNLAAETRTLFGVRCRFACARDVNPSPNVCLAFYRIFREAAHNAIQHGNAKVIRARADLRGGELRLRVADDGTGFDPAVEESQGMGLRLMKYRVREIGGQLRITSALGNGTCVECIVKGGE
jgi:PAS domain S-box-containing protein